VETSVSFYTLEKQFALTISRGTVAKNENLWLRIEAEGVEGWGEVSGFSTGNVTQLTRDLYTLYQQLAPTLQTYSPWQHQAIRAYLAAQSTPSALQAAIDMALYDWRGKRLGVPLWQLWGLSDRLSAPLSVTVGISSPQNAQKRLQVWLDQVRTGWIKVKLGNPDGIAADRALFEALQAIAPPETHFLVDANGGWSLADALEMVDWLADRSVVYVEQPLAVEQEADLKTLKKWSSLPLFADESCWTSQDIPRLADRVDGINIKLMKSGGLTEALAMIATARSFGLQVMLGCYSDSSLSNTAATHLGSLVDYLDLDSHLNLNNDPFVGATVQGATLRPSTDPGLGVRQKNPSGHPQG